MTLTISSQYLLVVFVREKQCVLWEGGTEFYTYLEEFQTLNCWATLTVLAMVQ
jgi:hypothetical protein